MTTILLDTNGYLRLAKRIRPVLGVSFGAKKYVLRVHPQVEDEVFRNPALTFRYPWFTDQEHQSERASKAIRLSAAEKKDVESTAKFIRTYAVRNAAKLIKNSQSTPGKTDCFILALAQVRGWYVATDDLPMHTLCDDFGIGVFHCCEVLKKMLTAKLVDNEKVIEIYEALENNRDLTETWALARDKQFLKVFRGR